MRGILFWKGGQTMLDLITLVLGDVIHWVQKKLEPLRGAAEWGGEGSSGLVGLVVSGAMVCKKHSRLLRRVDNLREEGEVGRNGDVIL